MTKIAIMQPTFMPWLGYFDLINSVDIFVFLDNVQLARRSWQVKNKIKTTSGELFVTLPVKKDKSRDDQFINNTFIATDLRWREKILKNIKMNYKKANYFDDVFPYFKEWISSDLPISEIHSKMIMKISNVLGIKDVKFIKSSSLNNISNNKETRLLDICKQFSAQVYLSPQGSSSYIEPAGLYDNFKKQGVELFYHNYKPVDYHQLHGQFIPYLGIFDLLFNYGFNHAPGVVFAGHKDSIHYTNFLRT